MKTKITVRQSTDGIMWHAVGTIECDRWEVRGKRLRFEVEDPEKGRVLSATFDVR